MIRLEVLLVLNLLRFAAFFLVVAQHSLLSTTALKKFQVFGAFFAFVFCSSKQYAHRHPGAQLLVSMYTYLCGTDSWKWDC